jgi:hypothetical protein
VSDARGQAYALTLLTRIVRGREDALTAALAALPKGPDSPLAALPGTHFARFVIVPDLIARSGTATPGEAETRYLLFSACFDGELDPYLWAICDCIPETADRIWGACDRYPGSADWAAFARWAEANQVHTNAFAGGYLDAPLEDVGEALCQREWLRDFALRARGMDPTELQTAFREGYPP